MATDLGMELIISLIMFNVNSFGTYIEIYILLNFKKFLILNVNDLE